MRTLRKACLIVIMAVVLLPAFSAYVVRAAGSCDAGFVCISTPQQLYDIRNTSSAGVKYQLANDIDLSGFNAGPAGDGGSGWLPINDPSGSFSGIFDGKGHTIKGMTINRPSLNIIGLFGMFTGEFKNTKIENANLIGNFAVGAVSGGIQNGKVENVSVSGDFKAIANNAGGITGSSLTVTIINSYVTGNISAAQYAGGLIGRASGPTTTITSSYAAAKITGSSTGGLLGTVVAGTKNITNAFYDTTVSTQNDTGNGSGLTSSQMKAKSSYIGFDFINVWMITANENNGYPTLKLFALPLPTTNVKAGIVSGPLAIVAPNSSLDLGNVTLTGQNQTIVSSLGNLLVTDATGTFSGYHVSVEATRFSQLGGIGLMFPSSSLQLAMPNHINVLSGSSMLAPASTGSFSIIDGGSPVSVVSAELGKGAGSYEFTFPVNALTLTLKPDSQLTDAIHFNDTATPFRSTLTWSIISGP